MQGIAKTKKSIELSSNFLMHEPVVERPSQL